MDRSKLAGWGRRLVAALRHHVMSAEKLHAEDTPVPVLEPGREKTKTGRLWTYVQDDPALGREDSASGVVAYTPDRRGEHPKTHLSGFTGTLQADAYAGYGAVYEGERVKEAACMAHVLRPFDDLYEAHKSAVAKVPSVSQRPFCQINSNCSGHPLAARCE